MLSTSLAVVDSVDEAVWEFFVNNEILTGVAAAVTRLGVVSVLLPLAAVSGFAVWRTSRSADNALLPFVSVYLTAMVVSSLKDWTDVPRPPRDSWLAAAGSASFPSGHVANTTALLTAVYLVSTRVYPRHAKRVLALAVVGSLAMGWTRLALNVHWFSDVVGGLAVGVAVTFAVTRVFDGVRSRRENPPRTRGAREG